jgi:hypothetical protein
MMTLEITPMRRTSEYSFDIRLNGLWVASAKNYHHADLLATELWRTRIIDAVVERMSMPIDVEHAAYGW